MYIDLFEFLNCGLNLSFERYEELRSYLFSDAVTLMQNLRARLYHLEEGIGHHDVA